MIKSMVILFEIKTSMTICIVNKWCGKYSYSINIKRFVIITVFYSASMSNTSSRQNIEPTHVSGNFLKKIIF